MSDTKATLTELQNHLDHAARALRAAWRLCKHNKLEPIAKELADTVLDVETAHELVTDTLRSNV